ncbi:MAG: SurA N-terminal domain-containing protein [Zoogloeaceae bacterium]|jgi:peptidyl-prolyl cis-trans isomerase D|nr:SurA N-terminal domain-containing protein [Zoogloeaceae bacterium]
MLDAIRNSKRIVQVLLALITVPFALWGLESYFRGGGNADIVQIGRTKISQNAFEREVQNEEERLKKENPSANPADLDPDIIREMVLDRLIKRSLLLLEAQKRGLNVRLAMQQMIMQVPEFQENGAFSQERYEAALASGGRTVLEFEAEVQEDLLRGALWSAVFDASMTPQTVIDRIITLQTETRDVQESLIAWQSLAGQVAVTDVEARQFYEDKPELFTHPEQIQVEYVVLTQNMLGSKVAVPEADLRAWYEGHKDRFVKKAEERRISHILRLTGEGVDKEKVRAESLQLLEEVKKEPKRFAELAKERSEDPGSAEQGGDLGFMARQMLVKPFADAAFSLKKGEISDLVESEFGFHIIRVEEIRPGEYFTFAEARPYVEEAVREQNMAKRFADAVENFENLVYEQSDSLKPAADAYGLSIQRSGWITRESRGPELIFNPKLMREMFGDEVLKNGRNSNAVEIAPGTLAAARLLEYQPARLSPFDEVKGNIVSWLREEKAQALAVEEGEAKLAKAREKSVRINWGKSQTVSRLSPGALHPAALDAILGIGTDNLPAYAGVALPGQGYAIYKITKADTPEVDPRLKDALAEQVVRFTAQNEVSAYLAALRQRHKVKINERLIREKEE